MGAAHLLVIRIGGEQIVLLPKSVEPGAGIKVLRCLADESGFDGIPLDVAAALKVVAFLSNSGTAEPFLEDVPRKSACFLKVAGISKLKMMHEP